MRKPDPYADLAASYYEDVTTVPARPNAKAPTDGEVSDPDRDPLPYGWHLDGDPRYFEP